MESSSRGGQSRPAAMQPLLEQGQRPIDPAKAEADSRALQAIMRQGPQYSEFDFTRAAHPFMCFFHFFFKAVGIIGYIVLPMLIDQVLTFIVIVICSAVDFWFVKNISGRILVGLRWWSEFDEDGDEIWKFESHDFEFEVHPIDRHIFWWSQVISSGFWTIIAVVDILSMNVFRGASSIICAGLAVTNLWGYYKCSKEHQRKVRDFMSSMGANALTGVANRIIG
eukprot:TRINITY_DN12152_c0_g1_i4.p1 TRINITY_DN12152_c0_g1~~TRINITY_DN12152_c0_g1_i4.p1  ORF type:complete len:224 (-),score=36.91 TRINITY_DN12152_c0_g1_i4:85-756(-)